MVAGAACQLSGKAAGRLLSNTCRGLCQQVAVQGGDQLSRTAAAIRSVHVGGLFHSASLPRSSGAGLVTQDSSENPQNNEAVKREPPCAKADKVSFERKDGTGSWTSALQHGMLKSSLTGMANAYKEKKQAEFDSYYNDYIIMGGVPRPWILGARISLCFKKGSTKAESQEELKQGLKILDEIIRCKLPHNSQMYTILITGCSKAGRADVAEELFKQMQGLGMKPGLYPFNAMIDTMCRTNSLEKAYAYYDAMLKAGITPNAVTFNILMHGAARIGNTTEANRIMKELMPTFGIQPSRVTFNSLINVYAKARDADGAYTAWQKMKEAGCKPDAITRTALMAAFRDSPVLPIGVWKEVNEVATMAEEGGERHTVQAKQRNRHLNRWLYDKSGVLGNDTSTATHGPGWYPHITFNGKGLWENARCIDLHGFSSVESRILVMEHLNDIARKQMEDPRAEPIGLHIITGVGNNNRLDASVLQEAVLEQLKALRIPSFISSNRGIVCIAGSTIKSYALRSQRMEDKVKWYQNILIRYSIVGGGLAAAWVVPYIWALSTGT